jgi:hypothetical protein
MKYTTEYVEEMITEWRFSPIKGNEDYIICDDGTAFSTKRKGKKLSLKPSKKKKYLRIRICKKAKESYLWVHRMVAAHFIGDIKGMEVHHIDNNTRNNHYTNFKIVTKRENLDYRNINNGWKL